MKKLIMLCVMLLVCSSADAQDKALYDLDISPLGITAASKIVPLKTTYEMVETEKSEFTLISDGYFTVGTTTGLAGGKLDDNCQITFGHPYAMTSYPFFTLDGEEQLPATYFYNLVQDLSAEGNILKLKSSDFSTIELNFEMTPLNNGETIRLTLSAKNLDSTDHTIGLGFMIDPALGKWGDGIPYVDGAKVTEPNVMTSSIPGSLDIWERGTIPRGLGMELEFADTLPYELHFDNWSDLNVNNASDLTMLYDTAVKIYWSGISIASGESVSTTVDLHLKSPEFNEGIFIRSDLPSFMDIQQNLLFPSPIVTSVEVYNNATSILDNLRLEFEGDNINYNWTSSGTFRLLPGSTEYALIPVEVTDSVDDHVVTLGIRMSKSGQSYDYLERNVFIPGIPRSEFGLDVQIDSVSVEDFPEVEVKFHALVEETSQIVTALKSGNVYISEDGELVWDFELSKDMEGGTNEADIVFVLDTTGSMTDEIESVKDNIVEFTDSLDVNGIDFRLAMVTFGDQVKDTYDFTDDPYVFRGYVSDQTAAGGGDIPENSLDALAEAAELTYRETANRIAIWITDASYHIDDVYTDYTTREAVDMLLMNSVKVHCIGNSNYKSTYYDPVTLATGGDFFDINGNFRDILLGITRVEETGSYTLTYTSDGSSAETHTVEVKAYYAGLGGNDTATYDPSGEPAKQAAESNVACYPNPFNPVVHISMNNPELLKGGIDIYNILGQKVRSFTFNQGSPAIQFMWDAKNDAGENVSNGVYLVRARLIDNAGKTKYLPVAKVICAK